MFAFSEIVPIMRRMKEAFSVKPSEYSNPEFSTPIVRFYVLNSVYTPFEKSRVIFAISESGTNSVIKIPSKGPNASREWKGLQKTYAAGVMVPEPLALATTEQGEAALISRYVEGSTLYKNANIHIRNKMGNAVLRMHEGVAIGGKEWLRSEKPNFVYYDKSLTKWSKETNAQLGPASDLQSLIKKFASTATAYCEVSIPVFNHNDLHEGQVIVSPFGDIVLLDFENWREDTRLNDIAYYLFQLIRTKSSMDNYREFLKGYLGSRALTNNERSVLSFYLLFISARALNYFLTSNSKYTNIATDTHNRVLKFIQDERLWKDF